MNRHNIKYDELFCSFVTHQIEFFDQNPFCSQWIARRYFVYPQSWIDSVNAQATIKEGLPHQCRHRNFDLSDNINPPRC